MAIQRNIKKIEIPIFNSQVPVSQNNTFPIQFRVTTEDGAKVSPWSNVYEIAGPTVEGGDTLTIKSKSSKVNIAWEDDNNRVLYDVFVHRFADIDLDSGVERSIIRSRPSTTTAQIVLYDNKDTRTDSTRQEHHLKVGMRIIVADVGSDYNIADTYVISVPDPYTFIYSPVPTTNMPAAAADTSATISIHASSPDVITNVEDYSFQFAGRTNKNTFSINKGNVVAKSASGASRTFTATDVWCLVQNSSADKKANEVLDISTGHIPV